MQSIAFYAPMKSPTHPTPSGDREIARSLLRLLNENKYGLQSTLVSDLRIYDGNGDKNKQHNLITQAAIETDKLIKQGCKEDWAIWVTYHNYYKAPDLIGPIVSKALGIPYVLLEATRSKKRLTGQWAEFAERAEYACDQADVIFYFTQQDKVALDTYKTKEQKIIHLAPFLEQKSLTVQSRLKPHENTLLSVGMMREGAKSQSYKIIAEVLHYLETKDWHLNIVGSGPIETEIKSIFQSHKDSVSFLGQLGKADLKTQYTSASALLWPGVEEAFGMVYLEAQAAGLPIIAQNRPGVRDVINPAVELNSIDAPNHMAQAIDKLLTDEAHWQMHSQAGLEYIENTHLQPAAAKKLWSVLLPLIGLKP